MLGIAEVNASGIARQHAVRKDDFKQRFKSRSNADRSDVTDMPLCWLLLGVDAITADMAPPPPNWAMELASMPSPPPNRKVPVVIARKARSGGTQAMTGSQEIAMPPEGTPEYTAARLLLCLRRVVRWQQRVRSQRQLHALVRERKGTELPLRMLKPAPCKQDARTLPRPRTPDVLARLKERDHFWQPMHSQMWRRRELQLPKPTTFKKAGTTRSLATSRSLSHGALPPVRDVVKKYDRGAPALGAGFKVLAGFRTETGSSTQVRPPAEVASNAKLLSLEGAVDLLRDWGVWPVSLPPEIQIPKSMGALPPLRQPVRASSAKSDTFPSRDFAQESTELGQASTQLLEDTAELTTTLGPDEFGFPDGDDVYSRSYNATIKSLPVPQINPLTVFPDLKRRAPMPAKRIFFTDPGSDDPHIHAIRDPVGVEEIHEPPPPDTPSSVASLTQYSLLMASVMRGDLLSGSLRKPRETAAELKVTLELASSGLEEALDEPPSDPEYTGQRHPPPWTRKRPVLTTSGVRDFADMGPGRQPQLDVNTSTVADAPQWAYMKSCERESILPKAHRPLVKAIADAARQAKPDDISDEPLSPSSRDLVTLDLAHHSLGDSGLQALGQTMAMIGPIDTLNLAGNTLTCKGTDEFLRLRMDYIGTIRELDLSRNQLLGENTFQAMIDLLHDSKFRRLESLHLSGIPIPEKLLAPLIQNLRENVVLRALSLADTRLGFNNQEIFRALIPVLDDGALTALDLSSNFIRKDGAEILAQSLGKTRTLQKLDLSYNAGDHLGLPDKMLAATDASEELSGDLPFSPLLIVLEGLQWNSSLRKVRLANCSLDFAADFVVAEALLRHPVLSELDLTSNPHGLHGLACLLRAIGVPHSSVSLLDVADFRDENIARFACKYDFKDPSGQYTLNLKHPQHRSVLRTLLDRPKQGGKDSKACFQDVSYDGTSAFSIGSISQDPVTGIHKVPMEGILRFSYGMPAPISPRGDNHPLAKVHDWQRQGLIHLGFERSLVLASAYRTCVSEHQKLLFAEALCRNALLKSSQLELFLQCSPKTLNIQILQRLAPNVVDCSEILELSLLLGNLEERIKARGDLRALAFLNMRNPTGHYRLQLANICDRACAVRLQVLAAFEAAMQKSQGRPDISQRGNFEPIRNAQHNGHGFLQGLNARTFKEVMLPFSGVMELDYTTFVSSRKGLQSIPAATLQKLLAAIRHSKTSRADTLQAFRGIADRFSTTAADIVEIINAFAGLVETQDHDQMRRLPKQASAKPPRMWMRVEALLACFGNCVQKVQIASKLLCDPELFTTEECVRLRSLLGPVFVFDWARCDDNAANRQPWCSYSCDLTINDERVVAKFILSAVAKQGAWECLAKPAWTKEKLAEKPPEKVADWVNSWLGDFPGVGVFSMDFMKGEGGDNEKHKCRREIAQKLGFEV